jgi:hypothetical protein
MAFTASGSLNGAAVGLLRKVRKEVPEFLEESRQECRSYHARAFVIQVGAPSGAIVGGNVAPGGILIAAEAASTRQRRRCCGANYR